MHGGLLNEVIIAIAQAIEPNQPQAGNWTIKHAIVVIPFSYDLAISGTFKTTDIAQPNG
jgi:hypothetical protein